MSADLSMYLAGFLDINLWITLTSASAARLISSCAMSCSVIMVLNFSFPFLMASSSSTCHSQNDDSEGESTVGPAELQSF